MHTRFSAFTCAAWATAAILAAAPASATLVTKESGTWVSITPRYRSAYSEICGQTLSYEQFMTIDGGEPSWVPVTSLYSPGNKPLSPYQDSCEDGYIVYGVGDCECSTGTALDDADSCQIAVPDGR